MLVVAMVACAIVTRRMFSCHGALHLDCDVGVAWAEREGLQFWGGLHCGASSRRPGPQRLWTEVLLPLHLQCSSHRGLQNPRRKAGPPGDIEREGAGGHGRTQAMGRRRQSKKERWHVKVPPKKKKLKNSKKMRKGIQTECMVPFENIQKHG